MCLSKVPFALNVESEASAKSQELENFNTRLETVEEKLTKILQGFKTQENNLQKTTHKDDSFTHLATSIVTEQKEKENRQLNLILHNIEESTEEPLNRKKDNINKVTSLLPSI